MTLGKYPRASAAARAEEQKAPEEARVLGLALAPESSVKAGEHGVVIAEISPTGRAAESDLQTGDIILDVGRTTVNTPAEVRKLVEQACAQSKKSLLFRIKGPTRCATWPSRSAEQLLRSTGFI